MNTLQNEISCLKETRILELIRQRFSTSSDFDSFLEKIDQVSYCLSQVKQKHLPPNYSKKEMIYRLSEVKEIFCQVKIVVKTN